MGILPVLVIFSRGLLDELTALLDRDSQLNWVPAVQRLVKNCGLTALWVTNRLDELNYCGGAFLLEKSEVRDRGDTKVKAAVDANLGSLATEVWPELAIAFPRT
jgi:ABC-type cobalamin/Fe3+-siderophores transport system ATPase subunit